MSPFWQAFWGGVLGKIAGAIFIAACVVMWLGPEDWVKWVVSDLPAFFSPAMARWVFFVLGAVVLFSMVYPLIQRLIPGTKKTAAAAPQNEVHNFALANLDEWRKVDPLELWRAGCLWKGFQPHDRIPFNDPAYASYIMLVNAAKAGQLTVTNLGTEVDAWSLVTRSELGRFARSKGETPEFLRDIKSEIAGGPTYWSLSETLSWIAFGEATTARQWGEKVKTEGLHIRPEAEVERFNTAEQELFEKLRGKETTALGKKDHSELYEEIPAEYFLSDVECKILHDQIDVSSKSIGVMQRWRGPKWRDVRFKREDVLRLWPQN